jgi:pyruvate formate lyase activating enzyme
MKKRVTPSQHLTKREFLKLCSLGLGASLVTPLFLSHETAQSQVRQKGLTRPKLSPFFKALSDGEIQCELCPKGCRVPKGERGACRVRENRDGKYYSLVYGNPCSIHLDPVEKKPFSHVLPATTSLSIATAGCNFHCKFCQNWEISQASPEEINNYDAPPEWIVKKAKEVSARSIAYTYVEPTVFYEYMADVSAVARKENLLNVIH